MNKLLVALLLALFAVPAVADVTVGAVSGSQSQSAAGSYSSGQVSNNIQYSSSSEINYDDLAPPVAPPSLVNSYSPDVCVGSVSGGVSAGGIGISAGSTVVDESCVLRRDARLLYNIGEKEALVHLLCSSPTIGPAMRDAGKCPQPANPIAQVEPTREEDCISGVGCF